MSDELEQVDRLTDKLVTRDLARLLLLNQQMSALERAGDLGDEHERLGRARAVEITRLTEGGGLWQGVSLASELGISIGELTSWEAWE